jgi:hypothetical protein
MESLLHGGVGVGGAVLTLRRAQDEGSEGNGSTTRTLILSLSKGEDASIGCKTRPFPGPDTSLCKDVAAPDDISRRNVFPGD